MKFEKQVKLFNYKAMAGEWLKAENKPAFIKGLKNSLPLSDVLKVTMEIAKVKCMDGAVRACKMRLYEAERGEGIAISENLKLLGQPAAKEAALWLCKNPKVFLSISERKIKELILALRDSGLDPRKELEGIMGNPFIPMSTKRMIKDELFFYEK